MCSSSFGILDEQRLYECSDAKCGEQYCHNCVSAIQGVPPKHPFTCISCRTDIQPQQNSLLEKHLIWPNMSKLYGTGKLLDLQSRQKFYSSQSVLNDIEYRRIHLQSRLNTFLNQSEKSTTSISSDRTLINHVKDVCGKLEVLTRELRKIDSAMKTRGVIVSRILDNYKSTMKDFDRLVASLRPVERNDPQRRMDISEVYAMQRLDELSPEQNIPAIDAILEDLGFRKIYLSNCLETCSAFPDAHSRHDPEFNKCLEKAKKKLEKIEKSAEDLTSLRANLRAIEVETERYITLLTDERQRDIPGSGFISLLETLRTETEKLEVAGNFPLSIELMNEWWNELGNEEDFKPKIVDLCRTIEKDIEQLFTNRRSIYSIPYKIGVVGNTSVGKSALIMALSNFKHFSSMVSLERSTFGYLQFEAFFDEEEESRHSKRIPISFLDIAGATDDDSTRSVGNYQELIAQSDCDLYLIVFDKAFDKLNQAHLDYICNTLERQCFLVRTKVDLSFQDFYKANNGNKFRRDTATEYDIQAALEYTRDYSSKTYDEKRLTGQVFLTAAGEESELKNELFGQFDLRKLKKQISSLAARDLRLVRVRQLAILASKVALNTCFRRGYVASKSKYRWMAAGASVIPFLDRLPTLLGEEDIRQSFGIQDRSLLTNTLRGSKDSFEEYLIEHHFTLPPGLIKSNCFQYLTNKETEPTPFQVTSTKRGHFHRQESESGLPKSRILSTTFTALGAIGQLFKDGIRMALPVASGTLSMVSLAGIAFGALLAPVAASWSFYSTGQRLNRHLHLLCDDLQTILAYLIIHICNPYQPARLTMNSFSDDDRHSTSEDSD